MDITVAGHHDFSLPPVLTDPNASSFWSIWRPHDDFALIVSKHNSSDHTCFWGSLRERGWVVKISQRSIFKALYTRTQTRFKQNQFDSVSQSVGQSVSQSVSHSVGRSVGRQSVSQSVSQGVFKEAKIKGRRKLNRRYFYLRCTNAIKM